MTLSPNFALFVISRKSKIEKGCPATINQNDCNLSFHRHRLLYYIFLFMHSKFITELKDTQNERDHRRLAIDRVGVKDLRYPIQVLDKARDKHGRAAPVQPVIELLPRRVQPDA